MMTTPDPLQIYFGADYKINEHITIHQPTVGEIIDYGEQAYWKLIGLLTATPSDLIYPLWEMDIDWEELPEFDLFAIYLINGVSPSESSILFGDLDLSAYQLRNNNYDGIELYNPKTKSIIDWNIYRLMTDYMRMMSGIKKTTRKAANKFTKDAIIELDKSDKEKQLGKKFESHLLPLISAMINSPGFKYNLQDVRTMPYSTFIDCVNRIAVIKNAEALSMGRACGFADLSKIPQSQFDWMRALSK